ncbi:MAG TPA: ABC transporter ATP-binding protein [bacterium]|nr:ABC transporter ATP-binding protein [bacterium]
MLALSIAGFTKKYGNEIVAVNQLNLDIPTGQIMGLIGPNGAGKTTTINYIAGLVKPDKGELSLFGKIITEASYDHRRYIGIFLEQPIYFEKLTGIEYLHFCGQMHQLPKEQIISRTDELIALFDLVDKKDKYIEKYSKGMKKKIALAASIIHAPLFLALDEPFEGIDPASVKTVIQYLLLMKQKGKTVLITSHILSIVEKLCDEVVIMDKGNIVFKGCLDLMSTETNSAIPSDTNSKLEEIYEHFIDSPQKSVTLSWL